MVYRHISAMPDQAIEYLRCRPGGTYVDCTLGGCGHARTILRKIQPHGLFVGIDQDHDAITNAKTILKGSKGDIHLVHDNFSNLPAILSALDIQSADGILVDLGVSLNQIESSGRGFSFLKTEPLDMRMNTDSNQTAEDIVNLENEDTLKTIFKHFGDERRAGQIAKRIIRFRKEKAIRTSEQLARLVWEAVPPKARYNQKIHPATRVFMALRIAVNRELERLEAFMNVVVDHLAQGGRLCVLSFHSLEDRIVKRHMKELAKGCVCPPEFPVCGCNKKPAVKLMTKKAVRPDENEIKTNPMARSTRLRAMEKL